MKLSELGEFGLLAELERRGLARRIEHDAAEVEPGLVVTQDALLEGVHFRLEWTSWHDLGYKAAAVNLSDLAASGAEPLGLIVSLLVPGDAELDRLLELYAGLNESGVPVLGGDTSAADQLALSVTALGRSERIPGRAGARPGDQLVVSGSIGASAAGFLCLREGIESPLVQAHLRPPVRLEEGRRLGAVATAMLDVSDGLAVDAGRLAARSACRCVIELERVPLAPGVVEVAEALGADLWELACGFGEDYELLAALPETGRPGRDVTVIGRCEPGEGVELRLGGRVLELGGWDHFSR